LRSGFFEGRRQVASQSPPTPLEEVIEMCRLFQWLLPGLITNVAYFRHQLEAVE
jgi:hypothetical protein